MPFATYSDLKTSVLSFLGRPGDPLIPIADIIALFEADASRKLRTHYQEVRFNFATVAGQAVYSLPSDFLGPRELTLTNINPIRKIDYVTPAQLDDVWSTDTTTEPFNYTIEGKTLRFGPIPDAVYQVRLEYWQAIPALSDASVATIALGAGGSLYTAGDVLTVAGGTADLAAQITVDTVDGGGAVLTQHVSLIGDYITAPTNPVAVTGGTGSGATFNLTFSTANTTNWLLQMYPDQYLTGSLVEAQLFLGSADDIFQTYYQRREAGYNAILLQDRRYRYGGAPLTMRSDVVR